MLLYTFISFLDVDSYIQERIATLEAERVGFEYQLYLILNVCDHEVSV